MKYVLIVLFGLSLAGLAAQTTKETSPYQPVKLKKVDLDIFQSLYTQDGDHSAVTGGHGSEALSDYATNIELNLLIDGKKKGNENNLTLKFGVDAYTSASSDKINPNTISSASSNDVRIYPSISYLHTNGDGHFDIGGNVSYSYEYDYQSAGLGFQLAKRSPGNNSEIGLTLQSYTDLASIIYPIELRPAGYPDGSHERGGAVDQKFRFSNSASLVYSQVISRRLQAAFLVDGVYQKGFLSTSFNRTAFANDVFIENLPDSRLKFPVGVRLNYFATDHIITKFYYRYYMDSWGIQAHTYSVEVPLKLKSWFSIYPTYRYFDQQGVDYFYLPESAYNGQEFYSNDHDLSTFTSHYVGLGMRVAPPRGIFHAGNYIKGSELNLKVGYYNRSDGLQSGIVSLHLKFTADTDPYRKAFRDLMF